MTLTCKLLASVALLFLAIPPARSNAAMVPMASVADQHGYTIESQAPAGIVLTNSSHRAVLYPDSRRMEFDGQLVFLNGMIEQSAGAWAVSSTDVDDVLRPLLQQSLPGTRRPVPIVAIDPGHGGEDGGSIGQRRIDEKELTLDIAFHVRQKLLASAVDARLTREGDAYVSLADRCAMAKEWDADVMISIHLNSGANGDARGIETYVLPDARFPSTSNGTNGGRREAGNTHDAENTLLAYYAQKGALFYSGASDRGVKRARYDVLCNAPCPAVLIECGFLSNPQEERRLLDVAYRDRIAEGIARGILTYLHRLTPAGETLKNDPVAMLTGAAAIPSFRSSGTNMTSTAALPY